MYEYRRLSGVFESAQQISFDDSSKIILMSDCHRGDGSWVDDFSKNQYLYFAALTHYYNEKYTYIELGDGDELWKNTRLTNIMREHSNVFWLLSKFFREGRLYFLYGNHDMIKKNSVYVRNNFTYFFDEREKRHIPLFENIKLHEGLVLNHTPSQGSIFLVHGHQVDYLNDRLWKLSRFLVRHLWKPLEMIGVHDPTSTSGNYEKKETVERILTEWSARKNQMVIAGHTHRPVFPNVGEPMYFNDGSCVHPRCITGIEIAQGNIMLVKWEVKTKSDGAMFVGREVLDGPVKLTDYFAAPLGSSRRPGAV
jgi:UDP-2,3-diacylglucosamine pyrophosphatase LpxH